MKLENDIAVAVPDSGLYKITIQNMTATGLTLQERPIGSGQYSVIDNETFTSGDTRVAYLEKSDQPNFKYVATGGDADVYVNQVKR